jgi:hypothetical protein
LRDQIRRLVRLQAIGFEIRDAEAAHAAGPVRIAALEEEFRRNMEEIGAARLRHEDLVLERQRLHEERESLQKKLEAGHQKLMQVSNQREYSAVLNEIDANRSSLATTEEGISRCDEEIEQLSAPAAEADERIEAARGEVERLIDEVRREQETLAERIAALHRQRDEIVAELPPALARRFEQISRARDGIALAAIDAGACGACHVRLRPQVISLARRSADIVLCDSCRRILYVPPEEPAQGEADDKPEDGRSLGDHSASAGH